MSRIGNDSNVLFQPRHHGDARDTRTAGSVATSTSPPRRQCLPRYETAPPAPAGAVKAAGDRSAPDPARRDRCARGEAEGPLVLV
jgi:hypothetical protein